jgi:hypothetical protein
LQPLAERGQRRAQRLTIALEVSACLHLALIEHERDVGERLRERCDAAVAALGHVHLAELAEAFGAFPVPTHGEAAQRRCLAQQAQAPRHHAAPAVGSGDDDADRHASTDSGGASAPRRRTPSTRPLLRTTSSTRTPSRTSTPTPRADPAGPGPDARAVARPGRRVPS